MDDKPEQEEPKKDFNKLDLNQLEGFSFGTQWSQEKAAPGGGGRGRDDRPRRDGPRDDRKDRRGFKRPSGPPRGDGGGAGGPGGGDRRPQGGGRGPGQGQGGRGRDTRAPFRGDQRRDGGYSQAPMGPYISPHFDATFYPEDVSFAALAKTIRASCRTFELFDIAKTVIAKHDRFVVVLDRKPSKNSEAAKRPFYVSMPDSVPFESEEDAINHVMRKHLDKFFSTAEVETDPPKGSFQVINKCGVTGELLGPPNYHLYNQTLQQHHANRLARMPFETFKSRIESVREPEVIEAWLELMKKVTRYTWLGDGKPAAVVEAKAEAPAEAPVTETPASESAPDEATSPEADVAADAPEATDASTETPIEEAAPEPAVADAVTFDSVNEAKVFLLTKLRDKVVRTFEHGRFHGREIENMPDSEIKRAVIGALERQQRFPLDSANALRGRLRREGFTIFKKGSKGVSYVCAVKRKFRVPGQTFADSIDQLISFIEKTPMIKVSELPEKFLGIGAAKPEEKKPAAPVLEEPATEAEAPVAPAPADEKPAETEAPAPAPEAVPEKIELSAEDQGRFKRMTLDLRWLVTEGYVTEFIDGGLFASAPIPLPKPKPKPASKPKAKPERKPDAAPEAGAPAVVEAAADAPVADAAPVAEAAADVPASESAPEVVVEPAGEPAAEVPTPVETEAPVETPAPAPEVVAPVEAEPVAPAPEAEAPVETPTEPAPAPIAEPEKTAEAPAAAESAEGKAEEVAPESDEKEKPAS